MRQGIRNAHPRSKGTGETFVSMTVIHKKQGVAPSIRVDEIKELYTLLHKADPSVRLNPLYEVEEDDAIKFLPIGDPSALPLPYSTGHKNHQGIRTTTRKYLEIIDN
jgi:hypothetical protein